MSQLSHLRAEKDAFFREDPQSPLTPEQRLSFAGLHYFPENPALDLMADLEEFPEKTTVRMQTTTGDVQVYQRFGRFRLTVAGVEGWLTVYRAEYGLFLPFVDSQAGVETYGAGRYLEPELLPDGKLHVDFNLAYNPYCAYNEQWSCPITPAENHLKLPIQAGERVFHTPA
jgi:uncharacterized protein